MKKKTGMILGLVLIALVLGVTMWFVISNKDSDEPSEQISLDGTWLVYQCGEDLSRTEYLVFADNAVSDYRDGKAEAFATSAYILDGDTLEMPNLDMSFTVEVISQNNIVLTESNTRVWRLLLVGGTDGVVETVTTESIEGEYDVVMVGTQPRNNETITFTQTQFSFLQNNAETMASGYELRDGHLLSLMDLGRDYAVYMNGDNLLFIGVEDNGVWELMRK